MSDPQGETSGNGQRRSDVSAELSRSLGSIWQRHAGGRPSAVSVEFSGDVVRFVMQDAVSAIGTEPTEDDSGSSETRSPDSVRYRNEAIATVRRITRRRVRGYIPKRDKTTDVATDTYILEPVHIAR